MSKDKNIFGGLNGNFLYTPMSEVEQELISRLVEKQELDVIIHGWGVLLGPPTTFGDSRLSILVTMNLNAPETPIPVSFLDLELRTRSGVFLFREQQPTIFNGEPIFLGKGMELQFQWDIAIRRIDPATVKKLMPSTIGLTSRFTDKDTGDMSMTGNQKLTAKQKRALEILIGQEKKIRDASQKSVEMAVARARKDGFQV